MSEHRNEGVPQPEDEEPGPDFYAERDAAFAAEDELAMERLMQELDGMLGEENARRQWMKDATLTGELELPELDDLAPVPEPERGPDLG